MMVANWGKDLFTQLCPMRDFQFCIPLTKTSGLKNIGLPNTFCPSENGQQGKRRMNLPSDITDTDKDLTGDLSIALIQN